MGFLVEALRERGVAAFGIDISDYAIQNVHANIQPYCWVGSITEPFPQHYDLIICVEVLEHLPRAESEEAARNLCQYTDDILFSSTPFDYKEVTHFNVQPPEYWAELFAQHGFFRDVDFDASFILPWAVRFRRKREPAHRLVRDYERKFWLLAKENSDLRSLTLEMRQGLAQAPDQAAYDESQVELAWTKEQLRRLSRQSWQDRLSQKWHKLNTLGVVGKRPARRLPDLTRPLTQQFVAEHGYLNAVTILAETRIHLPTQPLQVTLAAADRPDQPIAARLVSPRFLPPIGPFTFRFPPIPDSQGQTYQLTMHSPEASAGDTAAVWYYVRPGRPNGQLFWGGQRWPGELVMSAAYGPLEASSDDAWNQTCWLPRPIFAPGALVDLASGVLSRK
jgi:hypothetical protein